ncbi:MAG TPA: bifunctional [glutamine synthetase] adenylyltransferase/[glutamine synthetase]-adenylyl-L-tyrosine phosphorylase, partial [Hyphomicrobiaceae bacterium]|nr:bifunctional [glutamine synthetase] adenylyltransferase/[glutamine synthetase]-adenylyl-L-tyrosine phosphorylase [Hyphomicrobiaceae bacterium]
MDDPMKSERPLHARLANAPVVHDADRAGREFADLMARSRGPDGDPTLLALIANPAVERLLRGLFSGSPYLTALASQDDRRLARLLLADPDSHLAAAMAQVVAEVPEAPDMAAAMRRLREFKAEIALLAALADLGGVWPVMRVTAALTDAADAAVSAAVRFLFRQLQRRGDWLTGPEDTTPDVTSGYMVLGMGKYGAHELNYSSDIDLIVFFEPRRARLRDGLDALTVYVRLTRDLVRLLQERTGNGYVFRVDLRLRPDPGATHVAMSTDAALHYYESFGQNWERAALIKARAVAGDIAAGTSFLKELAPFIWRKYLDFAAIADIHAMKRQIHAFKGFGEIGVAGHNIKLGRGGIREIEFFVQTQQLIAGGRQTDLRTSRTLDALERLVQRGWLKREVASELAESYRFFRHIEHRLQMVLDEQTQTLPEDQEKLVSLARFSGFADLDAFSAELTRHLVRVQGHYGALFEDVPELTAGTSNMVFAGEADDPQTIEALKRMRFSDPAQVIATVRGWHHGRYPAVRTPRARELLTEVQPLLIEALADTADPNLAFLSFDRFLANLPSSVQLFSLLRANPRLLQLIAAIMGSAPRLARILSRRSRVLDAVLDPGFFGAVPEPGRLAELIDADLKSATDLQEALDRARVVGSEQAFLIGVRLLSGTIGADQAGRAYATLAEHLIGALQQRVAAELARQHGKVAGGAAAVVAMGKLGGREMTASSDLDLIVVYDFDPKAIQSDGP